MSSSTPPRSASRESDYRLDCVPPDMIDDLWPWLLPLVVKLCARSRGELTPPAIRAQALSAVLHVWTITLPGRPGESIGAPLAVLITKFEEWSGEKVCRVVGMAGNRMKDWQAVLAAGEQRIKALGMDRIVFEGRFGWQRALRGWTAVHVVMEKRL